MATGVRYGGPKGIQMARRVTAFIHYHAMRASIALAQERGPFPAIEGSVFDPKNVRWQPPADLEFDWESIKADIRAFGIRNAAVTTVAPTGTIVHRHTPPPRSNDD